MSLARLYLFRTMAPELQLEVEGIDTCGSMIGHILRTYLQHPLYLENSASSSWHTWHAHSEVQLLYSGKKHKSTRGLLVVVGNSLLPPPPFSFSVETMASTPRHDQRQLLLDSLKQPSHDTGDVPIEARTSRVIITSNTTHTHTHTHTHHAVSSCCHFFL